MSSKQYFQAVLKSSYILLSSKNSSLLCFSFLVRLLGQSKVFTNLRSPTGLADFGYCPSAISPLIVSSYLIIINV